MTISLPTALSSGQRLPYNPPPASPFFFQSLSPLGNAELSLSANTGAQTGEECF